jgi:hypothetical protein
MMFEVNHKAAAPVVSTLAVIHISRILPVVNNLNRQLPAEEHRFKIG